MAGKTEAGERPAWGHTPLQAQQHLRVKCLRYRPQWDEHRQLTAAEKTRKVPRGSHRRNWLTRPR